MTWVKKEAYLRPGYRSNCTNCGPEAEKMPLEADLCTGFGCCTVTRDDYGLYNEQPGMHPDEVPKLQHYETMALADPEHDWQVHFYGAMAETHYQRHGPGEWVLIDKQEGFA